MLRVMMMVRIAMHLRCSLHFDNHRIRHTVLADSTLTIGTCETSRIDSIGRPIRFERDWPIQKFSNRIGRARSFAGCKFSQMTQTINGT